MHQLTSSNVRSKYQLIDLSVAFSVGMPKYNASWFPEFQVDEVVPESMKGADWKRRFTILSLFAHNGTHVESSDHVFRDGRTMDAIPLDHFFGIPIVVDLRDIPNGQEITQDVLESRIPRDNVGEGHIILLMTSYDDREWGKEGFWDRSPWLSEGAAAYLASLKPVLIGLDFQTEKPGERNFIVHKALTRHGAVLCEYLFQLDKLEYDTLFMALPIKINDVEASPVRAVGIKGVGR
ncbi:cyclase family protein [Paenibacillus caui]|uniref:cyclase family protein n=1 Tax=Paenibacillus caui TaxID=2873927 RepID=UPI001CA8199B|nr:cyclase family protein [Paenibacillus caui]